MRLPEIKNNVKDGFKRLNRSFKKVIVNYQQAEIHAFRVEVKKTRAFLRLYNAKLKIPKKIHKFYHLIGDIRNLQLIQQRIHKDHPSGYFSLSTHPKNHSRGWRKKIRHAIDQAGKMGKKKNPFRKGENRLLKKIPATISQEEIRQFVRAKVNHLEKLIAPTFLPDENLHGIRKILKDFLYTWPYIQDEACGILGPVMPVSQKYLRAVTQLLGDFQDTCTHLKLLEPDPKKKDLIKRKWEKEKEDVREEIQKLIREKKTLPVTNDQPPIQNQGLP